ncbi:RNA-binding domain-containing protein [Coniophora puteana RWD-64-598 SS2]|uniref:Probable RNA-binding protein 18 n=1 Tax=Coniophora puteana (strain RWD-64-598) TaxID=741705 RepID=A0A5M3MA35_CONPW|nr:RNA-binding domain-containing protein [Coniophora puteana RWD-64-598 SS2]EIW76059.1 RNA-binding domain-containing protein [Coniophora puteana RWD-64-598 SS2]
MADQPASENASPSTTPLPDAPPAPIDQHLYIPEPEVEPVPSTSAPRPKAPALLKHRLYVGNLSHTMDEYALIQVFSKFGKVTKLDFLFHKSGPNRGKPRGYAFVEYAEEADARKAVANANGKLLRGRKLMVSHAQEASPEALAASSHNYGYTPGQHGSERRRIAAEHQPTALSLLKSAGQHGHRNDGMSNKIAQLEAKLRQMEEPARRALRPPPEAGLPQRPLIPCPPELPASRHGPASTAQGGKGKEKEGPRNAAPSSTTTPGARARVTPKQSAPISMANRKGGSSLGAKPTPEALAAKSLTRAKQGSSWARPGQTESGTGTGTPGGVASSR